MTESIALSFTYGRAEYIRAMRRYYKRALRVKQDLVLGAILIGLGLYFASARGIGAISVFLLIAGVALFAIIGSAFFIIPNLMYARQPSLKQQYDLVFSDTGIDFRTAGIDAHLGWSIYHAWLCDSEFYLLYHGKRGVSVIPRRAFPDNAEDRAFCQMLTRNIGKARARKRHNRY